MYTRKPLGFTLIEVMVVILIIAVLAAIALPSYTAMMQRSRRSEAAATLNEQQLRLERHRVDNASYATYVVPASANTDFYTVALSGGSATAYTLTATPRSGTPQASDKCGAMTITFNAGTVTHGQAATGSLGECW